MVVRQEVRIGIVGSRPTTQTQRPGPRDASIGTVVRWPGSLQRMVRPRCHDSIPPETQLLGLWQLLLVDREVSFLLELNEVRAKVIRIANKRFDVLGQHVELQ